MIVVLDASAAFEMLVNSPKGKRILEAIRSSEIVLTAPHLIDLEVAQVARRYVLAGQLTAKRGAEILDDLTDLDLERYSHDILLPRIWQLKQNMTAYDAAYIALAELLEATLLTCDHKLASAPGTSSKIRVF